MVEVNQLESLLQDAIALLEASGFPMAAETLRDNLRGIRTAPTAAARRRRVFQLRDLCDGSGPGPDVFQTARPSGPESLRYRRTEAQRRDEERYRSTLDAIQRLLAPSAAEETDEAGWSPSIARVA